MTWMAGRYSCILSMAGGSGGTGLIWAAVLLAGGVAAAVVLLFLRKRFDPANYRPEQTGFTIEELEALRRSGKVCDEEFRSLRRSILGLDKAAGGEDNPALRSSAEDVDESDTAGN